MPRGWLCVGILAVVPAFVGGGAPAELLAVSLGGMLLAHQALAKADAGSAQLAGAVIAWHQVGPLFRAAAGEGPLVEAQDLVLRYQDRAEPVHRGASLRILSGEPLLLEGPSGGGKSTLASLLVGLRQPSAGMLLLGGLDRRTLGAEGWRRRVVAAPQFHEDHVLTETFAFNLLMGRRWPPTQQDLQDAERLCHDLGLGPLLSRMPSGLQQMVGETGWQLWQSRLFMARALLQRADLVVLDETFGALDPETMHRAPKLVLERRRRCS